MEQELVHFTMLKIDFEKALSGEGTLSEGAVEVEEEGPRLELGASEPSLAWDPLPLPLVLRPLGLASSYK